MSNNMQNNNNNSLYGYGWQQSSQQMNYTQYPPLIMNQQPMGFDNANRFSAPPPPPPPETQNQSSDSMQHQNMNMRRQGNFNQGFNNNNNRGQQNSNSNNSNNRQQNARGPRRNMRGGGHFGGDGFNSQNSNNMNSNNFNDQKPPNQMQNNFGNMRGKNNNNKNNNSNNRNNNNNNSKGNWMKNKTNQGPSSSEMNTNVSLKFAHDVSQQASQPISLNTNNPNSASSVTSFEEEFRKWEEQFEKWQHEMRDHPDKQQYDKYKEQFMQYREALSTRLQKLKEKSISNPPMTDEQIKFSTEWSAGDPIKTSVAEPSSSKTVYNPPPITSQLPPAFVSNSDLPASSILFGCSTSTNLNEAPPISFAHDKFDEENIVSFEHAVMDPNYSNFNKNRFKDTEACIPGLDVFRGEKEVPKELFKEKEEDDVIIIVPNESTEPKSSPLLAPPLPPLPSFSRTKSRSIVFIDDILEEPGRSTRSDKILIIIRGAPGSGKHYLADLIYKKETDEYRNDRCRILSTRRFIVNHIYDPRKADEYDAQQLNECKEMMQEGYNNFAIVVLNGCGIKHFNKIAHMGFSMGKYECYSIEIHQKSEVCQKYDTYNRSIIDIRTANEDLVRFSTPIRIKLLDPSSLYFPKLKQPVLTEKPPPKFEKAQPPPQATSSTTNLTPNSSTEEFTKNLAQILQNENVMQLLQAQMSAQMKNNQSNQPLQAQNQQQQFNQPNFNRMPPMHQMREPPPSKPYASKNQANFQVEECPIFKPAKVVDYNHVHKQTFEESLMEFKVFRTIDYNHLTSYKLNEFIRDIDVDKVIEKRKAVALRKKILEYLRSAERPEDTVSNPKYPRNWEVIGRERPPRKSKRRKRLTAKIKRILMEKCSHENSWMTKGYVKDENEQMDLEAISSEDEDSDMDSYEKPAKIIKLDKVEEIYDEFRDIFKTIPDFNRFKHPRTISVKDILWLPDRKFRPHKILIIIRGAAGSGKSHLVQLIKRKEIEMGNSDIRILSIDDYYLTEEDEDRDPKTQLKLTQSYLENLQKHLKKTISDNLHNFIIIDAENCDLTSYNQFHQIGSSMGFSVYTIELYQMLDICMKQSKRVVAKEDIAKSIELLNKNRISNDHMLLIPTALYEEYKCFVNPQLSSEKPKGTSEKPREEVVEKQDDSIKNYQNYLVQTIDDDYLEVMPQFNWHNRETVDIREILEEPGRLKRSKNIAILMRGPGGSGKNELASIILNKEREHGNENCIFISIEEHFISEATKKYEFNNRELDTNIQKLIRKLLELMRTKKYNFIIVDVETGDFSHYMQIYELLSKQNQCYTIETYQDAAICLENDIHKRPIKEIESVLEEMHLNPTPDDHPLIDASVFYKHQSTVPSSDRPLKSALKTSPNTSFSAESLHSQDLEKLYESNSENASLHEKFQARFNQRININGKFIDRNSIAPSNLPEFNWFNENIIDIRDILEEPGRNNRSEKIAIFIRGAPCSGKTYLAALILRKEIEKGNEKNFHLLSIDEYFEEVKFRDTEFEGQYEKYIESNANASNIDEYMQELEENFESILDNNCPAFIVLDGDFCDLKYYNEMRQKAVSFGFTCYTVELNQDDNTCKKYNDHKWDELFILERNKMMREIQTPKESTLLDPEYLYHEYKYEFNENGDVFNDNFDMDITEEDDEGSNEENNELSFGKFKMSAQTSKWDDDEAPDIQRLDGIKSKSHSKRVTMADYLQTDDADEWSMRPSQSGKKRVRWADIEEKKAQEKMRRIGFIVGHTDWNRMNDESDGRSALEKTKFIEPRQKK